MVKGKRCPCYDNERGSGGNEPRILNLSLDGAELTSLRPEPLIFVGQESGWVPAGVGGIPVRALGIWEVQLHLKLGHEASFNIPSKSLFIIHLYVQSELLIVSNGKILPST